MARGKGWNSVISLAAGVGAVTSSGRHKSATAPFPHRAKHRGATKTSGGHLCVIPQCLGGSPDRASQNYVDLAGPADGALTDPEPEYMPFNTRADLPWMPVQP